MLHTEQHQHIKLITVNIASESVKFSFNLFIFKHIIVYKQRHVLYSHKYEQKDEQL